MYGAEGRGEGGGVEGKKAFKINSVVPVALPLSAAGFATHLSEPAAHTLWNFLPPHPAF